MYSYFTGTQVPNNKRENTQMATKKPPYSAKVKFWHPNFTGEIEGGMQGCSIELFRYLPAEQREKALEKMQAAHAELSAREAAKSTEQ